MKHGADATQHFCSSQLTSAACVVWNCHITLLRCREYKLNYEHFAAEKLSITLTLSYFFFWACYGNISSHLCPPEVLNSEADAWKRDRGSRYSCWLKYHTLYSWCWDGGSYLYLNLALFSCFFFLSFKWYVHFLLQKPDVILGLWEKTFSLFHQNDQTASISLEKVLY